MILHGFTQTNAKRWIIHGLIGGVEQTQDLFKGKECTGISDDGGIDFCRGKNPFDIDAVFNGQIDNARDQRGRYQTLMHNTLCSRPIR